MRRRRRRAALGASALVIALIVVVAHHRSTPQSAPAPHVASSGTDLDPQAFSVGACEAFAPTKGNRHQTVFLDAGHGGIDPGGVGTTESGQSVNEADVTLPIELDAMARLRAAGYRVVVSRTANTTVVRLGSDDESDGVLTLQGSHDDVAARDVCANLAKAAVLVGVYMNAAATPQGAGSVTVYDDARTFSADNLRLANLVQQDTLIAMNAQGWGIPNDGVLPDSGFGSYVGDPSAGGLAAAAASYNHLLLLGPSSPGYFTTPSTMPGVVIEPLYLTDPFEGSIAVSAHDQGVIARGIADAVEQYLAPPVKASHKAGDSARSTATSS